MAHHKFNCKFCRKYKEVINKKKNPPKYCSLKCSESCPKKRRSTFSWDIADEEETKAKILQNFYRNIIIKNGCWDLKKGKYGFGYGRMEIGKRKYNSMHRVSYELHFGEIPDGMQINHLCHRPECCRPSHMELGTQQDNMDQKVQAGRQAKGSKHGMSRLTKTEVIKIKKLLNEGKLLHKEIGEMFGVSKGCITNINIERTWRHVPWPDEA